jgi:hypothetical protein
MRQELIISIIMGLAGVEFVIKRPSQPVVSNKQYNMVEV